MFEQGVFYLGRADVVAGRDDHVIGAGLVEKVTVIVLREGVAGVVPAVFDVIELARIAHVFAAGGALHGEAAHGAVRHLVALGVHHFGYITRHHLPNGPPAHLIRRRRDEDVEHLGGANAVQHVNAGGLAPELAGGVGQALARTHAQAKLGGVATLLGLFCHKRGHLPVKSGCGVANGGTGVEHELRHALWGVGPIRKIHRGTGPHRKNQQAPQAKRKSQRR